MPTENRSTDADGWIACDDGLHLIQMDKNLSHYGWVFRKVDGGLPYSVREATPHEMAHAQARQHLRIGVAQIAGQAPAPQAQAEPASYPPCDYCGTVPSYHPWHGSGMLIGVENRHIHACDGCRGQLPSHPAPQPHPEPIAWMVGTAFWWTKEEAERDAAATGMPIVGMGPMDGAALSGAHALLREVLEFIDDGVGRSDAEWQLIQKVRAALSASAEPSEPIAWHVGGNGYDRICFEKPADLPGHPCIQAIHDLRQLIDLLKRYDLRDEDVPPDERAHGIPGTSFQRLNALANQGE